MPVKKQKKKPPSVERVPFKIEKFALSLFDQVPAHSLVFLRVAWGLVMLSEVLRFMSDDYYLTQTLLVDLKYMYKYPYFEWIPRASLDTRTKCCSMSRVCAAFVLVLECYIPWQHWYSLCSLHFYFCKMQPCT